VDVAGWLPPDTFLTEALGGASFRAVGDTVTIELGPQASAILITGPDVDLAPPGAPAALTAEATIGAVELAWAPSADAAGYTVWRSILSGGGYVEAGSVAADATTFTDRGARNGTLAHYVVTAVDAAGNASERSPQGSALPEVVVDDARLGEGAPLEQTLSAVDPLAPIEAVVHVDGSSQREGPTVGVRMEIGFGPAADAVAPDDAGWTWSPMRHVSDDDGADRWAGEVRPEEAGTYAVAARLSTDGGASWRAVGTGGLGDEVTPRTLAVVPGADTIPPDAPDALVATSVAETAVGLAWEPVADADLHRYEILRADGDGDLERVGVATEPSFSDESVAAGRTYRYAVRAQDQTFNRSAASDEISVGAEARDVAVTFTVSVPPNTPPGDTVFIAGDFQGWDPAATPLERVDEVTWQITLTFPEATPIQYKYARGTWLAVEKDAGCGEIPNRELTVQHGTDATLAQADTVAKWRDVDACP
jgi:hypothetical protein